MSQELKSLEIADHPATGPPQTDSPARTLQSTMAAVRLSVSWLGTRKALTAAQKRQAAESFGASDTFLSAGKKLFDTHDPNYRAVTAIRTPAIHYWRGMSLPYPDNGIRLIRHDDISIFHNLLQLFRSELSQAVEVLDAHYAELREAARERLGELFNPTDYPDSLCHHFALAWDFPNVHPPEYLLRLSPHLYEQEQQRITHQFEQAVQLAEDAFLSEFGMLVSHLTERLTGESDSKPKVFRDSAIGNLQEFFERFRRLNIRSNADLEELVEQAQDIVQSVQPQQLRDHSSLRDQIGEQLSQVQFALDGLLMDRPRRNLIRCP